MNFCKSYFLKFIVILFILTLAFDCFAEEYIKGHYCYTYGDNESLVEAKKLAYSYALRDAIEKNNVQINSSTKIKNYTVIYDIITNDAQSYLKNIKIDKYTVENRTICYSITAVQKPISHGIDDDIAREEMIKGMRRLIPEYGEMSDQKFINHIYNKYYSDLTREDFLFKCYNKFVLKESKKKSK